MNRKDARSLGRWCEAHQKQHRPVQIAEGAWATGCPDCLAMPDTAAALQELVKGAHLFYEQGLHKKESP